MTDSPHGGLSTNWATGPGARTRPPYPGPRERSTTSSPPRTACAARRRRPGPPAAPRSALRADPGPRRLSRRAHKQAKNRKRKITYSNTGLTDPAPSGMTCGSRRRLWHAADRPVFRRALRIVWSRVRRPDGVHSPHGSARRGLPDSVPPMRGQRRYPAGHGGHRCALVQSLPAPRMHRDEADALRHAAISSEAKGLEGSERWATSWGQSAGLALFVPSSTTALSMRWCVEGGPSGVARFVSWVCHVVIRHVASTSPLPRRSGSTGIRETNRGPRRRPTGPVPAHRRRREPSAPA